METAQASLAIVSKRPLYNELYPFSFINNFNELNAVIYKNQALILTNSTGDIINEPNAPQSDPDIRRELHFF